MTNEKKPPKTTYYNAFPEKPRPDSQLAHVFWVVANDHRVLKRSERRNVIYPAKSAGLIEDAPRDELGVRINAKDGKTSRCDFILTEKGKEYYEGHVKPVLAKDFKSDRPAEKTRSRARPGVSTADLKKDA